MGTIYNVPVVKDVYEIHVYMYSCILEFPIQTRFLCFTFPGITRDCDKEIIMGNWNCDVLAKNLQPWVVLWTDSQKFNWSSKEKPKPTTDNATRTGLYSVLKSKLVKCGLYHIASNPAWLWLTAPNNCTPNPANSSRNFWNSSSWTFKLILVDW